MFWLRSFVKLLMGELNNSMDGHETSHTYKPGKSSMKSSLVMVINARIGVAVAICVFIMGIVDFSQTKSEIEDDLDRTLLEISQRLGMSLVMPVWNLDSDVIEAIVETEMLDRDILGVVVKDTLSDEITIAKARGKDWSIIDLPPLTSVSFHRSKKQVLVWNNNIVGSVTVYVSDKFLLEQLLASIVGLVGKMFLLLILIITVLVFFLTKSVSRPVLELSYVCKKVARGDFDLEIDTSRPDEIGSLAGSFSQMRDAVKEKINSLNDEIRDRKRSEDELQRLRNLLANIVDSMPSVLVGVDRECRVTQWNLEACKVTGVSAEDACGRDLSEVLPFLKGTLDRIRQATKENRAEKSTKVKCVINDVNRIADIAVYPLLTNGAEGAVVRLDDVTDRVRLEEIIVQTERVMSIGGLAAGMAHEINNPLAGVMQSVQVIQNRISPKLLKNKEIAEECGVDMEVIHSYLEKRDILRMFVSIVESGKRAARIVDNMLSFSRKSVSQYIPCDMKDLLDKTVELAANDYDLKRKYDFRGINIVREYDSEVADVRCDASTIQQVFFNLLKNSAQAIANKIDQVSTPREDMKPEIILRMKQDGENVRIEFQDNGSGMDEETRKHIFEPFFTTKPVGGGTGLGLSVSFFIVRENHKGSIEVTSSPGESTTFVVILPV